MPFFTATLASLLITALALIAKGAHADQFTIFPLGTTDESVRLYDNGDALVQGLRHTIINSKKGVVTFSSEDSYDISDMNSNGTVAFYVNAEYDPNTLTYHCSISRKRLNAEVETFTLITAARSCGGEVYLADDEWIAVNLYYTDSSELERKAVSLIAPDGTMTTAEAPAGTREIFVAALLPQGNAVGDIFFENSPKGAAGFVATSATGIQTISSTLPFDSAVKIGNSALFGKRFPHSRRIPLYNYLTGERTKSRRVSTKVVQLLAANDNGEYLTKVMKNGHEFYALQTRRGSTIDLNCALPNSSRIKMGELTDINNQGDILADVYSLDNSSRFPVVLKRKRGQTPNYCPVLKATVVGGCARYFRNDPTSITQHTTFPYQSSPSCTIKATLTHNGKPLAGKSISLFAGYSEAEAKATATTDSKGQVTLSYPLNLLESQYWEVKFWADPTLRADSVTIKLKDLDEGSDYDDWV